MVWLSGLSTGLQTQRSLVWFPVRAQAWVAGQVPSWGHVRSNWLVYLSHIDTSLPLSPSLSLSLKIKINTIFLKKLKKIYSHKSHACNIFLKLLKINNRKQKLLTNQVIKEDPELFSVLKNAEVLSNLRNTNKNKNIIFYYLQN